MTQETPAQKEARQIREHLECCRPLVELERSLNKELGRNNPLPRNFDEAWGAYK